LYLVRMIPLVESDYDIIEDVSFFFHENIEHTLPKRIAGEASL